MNPWDFVVAAAIVALVVLAVWLMRRSRAKGSCACCPYAGECEKKPNRKPVKSKGSTPLE